MRIVPFEIDFDNIAKLGALSQGILWSSVIASALALVTGCLLTSDPVVAFLHKGVAFLAVAYFLVEIINNYSFFYAERKRRNDFFDNSLNTNLSEDVSQNYFTNDDLAPSIKKLGVNCFENTFFTKSVASAMLKPLVMKAVLVILLFVLLALFTEPSVVAMFVQLALPATVIQQTLRVFMLRNRVSDIYDRFVQVFEHTKNGRRDCQIILNVTAYESVLAWAAIKLDSDTFNKLNPELSPKWENLKQRYGLMEV